MPRMKGPHGFMIDGFTIDSQHGCKGKDWIGTRVGRYEYLTAVSPDYKDGLNCPGLAELEANGWRKAWSDSTLEGVFVVLRREVG